MSEVVEYLKQYIKPVEGQDCSLPEYSHSRLECFETCPYQFNLKYNLNKTSIDTNISLQVGSIMHLVLEYKGKMLINNGKVDYKFLEDMLYNGGDSDDGHGNAIKIAGINELKKKYFMEWNTTDSEGRTYNDKLNNFLNVLHTEMEDDPNWQPVAFEKEFRYVFMNKIILHGFIDRIDKNSDTGEYRIVDYKTSKKAYDNTKTATAQQMCLYNLALILETGQIAAENLYRFICINDSCTALTKNWETRFIKKMEKVLSAIDEGYETGTWKPSPKPLCRWCSFSRTNPDAHAYKNECDYYSLWTPENKVYEVNKEWNPELQQKAKKIFNW